MGTKRRARTPGSRRFAMALCVGCGSTPTAPVRDASPIALAAEPAIPDAPPPVTSYTLRASLDDATRTVHGSGTIRWVNTSVVATSELYFHFYLDAFENDHTLFNRSPFTRARSALGLGRTGYLRLEQLRARELGDTDLLPMLE